MAGIVYGWNPFQERVDCRVKNETIKVAGTGVRKEFVPRAAPFFAHEFKLYRQGSLVPLTPGIDYIFGHPFDRFIKGYRKNAYGSVILLKPIDAVLLADYDTIGGPFVLDQVAYATLVANIANSPRQADWANVVNVPFDFPPDPHLHPIAQTYDYLQMIDYLKNFILAVTETNGDDQSAKALLEKHLADGLDRAHTADKGMLGLDLTPNSRKATIADIAGNSNDVLISMSVVKEMFRRQANGTLKLDE